MEETFAANVRETGQTVIIDMSGDLSKSAHEPLLGLFNWETKKEDTCCIILNFSQINYINSLGIALLIRLTRKTERAGYQTFAYGISPHYHKLFLMVGLAEHMMIYPDEYSIMQRIETLNSL